MTISRMSRIGSLRSRDHGVAAAQCIERCELGRGRRVPAEALRRRPRTVLRGRCRAPAASPTAAAIASAPRRFDQHAGIRIGHAPRACRRRRSPTTGVPQAIASSSTLAQPSRLEASTSTSAAPYQSASDRCGTRAGEASRCDGDAERRGLRRQPLALGAVADDRQRAPADGCGAGAPARRSPGRAP